MGEPSPTNTEPLIGRKIAGKYDIVSLLGRGGMGAVFKAKQPELKRSVAIKVLSPQHAQDKTYVARFKREALAACRLDHANLMRVLDVGEEPDGLLYMVMELIDGKDLSRLLAEGRLATSRIIDIMSQTLAAVAVAHEQGVLHRDLKPENVMIVRGRDDEGNEVDMVKVCDFGIAKLVAGGPATETQEGMAEPGATFTATLTATGSLVGTPEYMSPEQAKGDPLDARSDIYALGMILYEMLAGRVPFTSANSMKVLLQHASEKPPRPSKYNPDADPTLEAVSLRAIMKDRDDRYATARDMRAAVRADRNLRDSAVAPTAIAPSSVPPPPIKTVSGVVTAGSTSSDRPPAYDKEAITVETTTLPSDPPPPESATTSNSPTMPPRAATTTQSIQGAGQNRTTTFLIALIVILLGVVAFLATRK
jgi:serine/threonine-protein kinase